MTTPAATLSTPKRAAPRRSRFALTMRSILRRRSAALGLVFAIVIVVLAVFAPITGGHDPLEQSLRHKLKPPGGDYVLGTDPLGRDVWSRLVWGARVSLSVGVVAVAISAGLGTTAGIVGGYFGGRWDAAIMRVIEVLMSFPLILLAIAIVAVLGPGLTNLMIAVGISSVPQFARLVRGEVLRVRGREFVEAARAIGGSQTRIMARHILPNVISAIVILATLRISTVILTESALSFLGLGISPPTPTWGSMIADGTKWLRIAPWISIIPGIAIMITVLAFNLLGDGLRDALDPRLRGE
ncbi:MAG: ABC transporter permease [Armatimonadetes bacterium]|nr:ABC transporter permease [Armatimonadota bacterium]